MLKDAPRGRNPAGQAPRPADAPLEVGGLETDAEEGEVLGGWVGADEFDSDGLSTIMGRTLLFGSRAWRLGDNPEVAEAPEFDLPRPVACLLCDPSWP